MGRLASIDAEGITVRFEDGQVERFTHDENGLGWRRAGS